MITISAGVRGNQVRVLNKKRDDELRTKLQKDLEDEHAVEEDEKKEGEAGISQSKKRQLRSADSHLQYSASISKWTENAKIHNESQGKKSKTELQGRQEVINLYNLCCIIIK